MRRAASVCLWCSAAPCAVLALAVAVLVPQLVNRNPCRVDAAGACKDARGAGPVACEGGAFVGLTRQPDLGLRHFRVSEERLAFAALTAGNCSVQYSLACGAKGLEVLEASSCAAKAAPTAWSLGETWEVCAGDASLKLLVPVVDLSFDIETAAGGAAVEGCVRVSAASALPQLELVRGSVDEQVAALRAKKLELGGCPTWRSEEDRLDRSEDFATVGGRVYGLVVRQAQKFAKEFARSHKAGQPPEKGSLKQILIMMGLVATGGGEHGATILIPRISCGMPTASVLPAPAVQVTRYADVAALVADPAQQRGHIIGGGHSEVCFDPTLPIFMSTGTPEHSQVRKLWDTVGLSTMHLADLPEVAPATPSFFAKAQKAALGAVGITVPMMGEIAALVAPLFLERLWGKKPTSEEAEAIGAYTSMGGLCIVSHVAASVPFLPGRILAIRGAALTFAKNSPTGQALAEEIQKPQYAELRKVYGARPQGVLDTALQNLVDASLFAGLIGTSTMTMNCVLQQRRGPEFVGLFRRNSTAFLLEVMRTATAVGGSQQRLRKPWKLKLAGEDVELPVGALVFQGTGIAASFDAAVFPEPYKFDSSRPNLGETMNWNGITKHVWARDYSQAPRFCPGAALSVKIAAKACGQLTAHLSDA